MKTPRQNTALLFVLILGLLLLGIGTSATCWGWSLGEVPTEGIVVLRNGNILRGKIEKLGEEYHVHLTNGKLRVRAAQVEHVCGTVQQAYEHRRDSRGGSTADGHLQLAAWCLRHDLFDLATLEIEAAKQIDADHRRLPLLTRQLEQSRLMAELRLQRQQAEPITPTEPGPLDPSALDKAPPWARALFVRQIQPLLVHSCASTGCHEANGKQDFHLNRLAVEGAGHPDSTQRNLAAVLQQIDWKSAEQSDLLERARRAHGTLSSSTPLPAHKLQVLQSWITQLAEAEQKANQMQSLPPVVEIAALPSPSQTRGTTGEGTIAADQVQQAAYAPIDAFDPQAFNTQFGSQAELATEPMIGEPEASGPILLPAAE